MKTNEIADRIEKAINAPFTSFGTTSIMLKDLIKELRGNQWPTTWEEVERKRELAWHTMFKKSKFPTIELWEAAIAQFKIMHLVHEMNGDWKPGADRCYQFIKSSYTSGSKFPFTFGESDWHWIKFPTEEAAKHFLKYFKDLLDQAKPLL